MRRQSACRSKQGTLRFKTWGGRRKGAGRRPKNGRAGVPHRKRARLSRHAPQITTLRLVNDVAKVRRWTIFFEIVTAIAAAQRATFRIVEFSVQNGHLHLITESDGWKALTDGTRALSIRIARVINRGLKRKGRVFADRFHARSLGTPREVKTALVYVIQNARKHLAQRGIAVSDEWLDPLSSAGFFRGWNAATRNAADGLLERWRRRGGSIEDPRAEARTWLLRLGWKRHGLLRAADLPAS